MSMSGEREERERVFVYQNMYVHIERKDGERGCETVLQRVAKTPVVSRDSALKRVAETLVVPRDCLAACCKDSSRVKRLCIEALQRL